MLLLGQFSLVALDGACAEFRVPATPGLEWVPRLLPNDAMCLLSALTTPLALARPLLENARVPSSTLASPFLCLFMDCYPLHGSQPCPCEGACTTQ